MRDAQPTASRSSVITVVVFMVVTVLNYAFSLFMVWLLPVQFFGVLGIAQSWILIAATILGSGLSWGVSQVIARRVSVAEAYAITKSAMVANMVLALAICLLLALGGVFGFISFGSGGTTIRLLIIGETVLMAIQAVLAAVLQGKLRFGELGIGRIIEAGIKLLAGVAVVAIGYGSNGAVGAIVVGSALSTVYFAWCLRDFHFWRERTWAVREAYQGAFAIFLALSAATVITNFDIIGLDVFHRAGQSDTLAGYYQAASLLPRTVILLARTYASVLFPYIAGSEGEQFDNYVSGGLKYLLLFLIPIDLVMLTIPGAVITLFFPDSYTVAAPVMQITALGSIFLSLTTVMTMMLQARNVVRPPAQWLMVAAVFEIVALWYLVPRYSINGAAFALLAASVLGFISQIPACRRELPGRLGVRDVVRYGALSGVLVGLLLVLPHGSDLATVLSVAVALVVYGIGLAIMRLLRPGDLHVLTGGMLTRLGRVGKLLAWLEDAIGRLNRLVPRSRLF